MVCQSVIIWDMERGLYNIGATGHAIRSNCALRACNHFYRCRGHQGNKTAVKNL